jgi:hypothetical protein
LSDKAPLMGPALVLHDLLAGAFLAGGRRGAGLVFGRQAAQVDLIAQLASLVGWETARAVHT